MKLILIIFPLLFIASCTHGPNSLPAKSEISTQSQNSLNDSLFSRQYYFRTMNVIESFPLTNDISGCLIGVLERDLNTEHHDIKDSIIEAYRFDDMVYGKPRSRRHGTQVVSIIAAQKNDNFGIAGLAPECKVIAGLFGRPAVEGKSRKEYLQDYETIIEEKTIQLIKYLVDKGCKVINYSFKLGNMSSNMFDYAIENDVVVVLGAGNDNKEDIRYEKLDSVILVVGGIDQNNKRWEERYEILGEEKKGSNYGSYIDVVAPANNLFLCGEASNTSYTIRRKGTSFSAPMVTSLVALIRSVRPDLNAAQVTEIVKQGADDLGEKGWDKYAGYGKINFYKSLNLAIAWPEDNRDSHLLTDNRAGGGVRNK